MYFHVTFVDYQLYDLGLSEKKKIIYLYVTTHVHFIHIYTWKLEDYLHMYVRVYVFEHIFN